MRPSDFSLDLPSVPTAPKAVEEPVHSAYCPLTQSLCSDVQCGKCAVIGQEFVDYLWVCSTCIEGLDIHAYYKNGQCDICGFESGILMLGECRDE